MVKKLRSWLRGWLGITQIAKGQKELWWDINDGSGLKAQSKAHSAAIETLAILSSQPDKLKWEFEDGRWYLKSKNNGWIGHEHSFYRMLTLYTEETPKHLVHNERNERMI